MEEESKFEKITRYLNSLEDTNGKILFLETYLRDHPYADHETKARVYNSLAKLNLKIGKLRGDLYQKAGSMWELASALGPNKSDEVKSYRKKSLKEALKNYQEAKVLFRRTNSHSLEHEVKYKISMMKKHLQHYGSPAKTISYLVVVGSFFSSFFFLSSSITGLTVAPLDSGGTTALGVSLVFMAILGSFLIFRFWR